MSDIETIRALLNDLGALDAQKRGAARTRLLRMGDEARKPLRQIMEQNDEVLQRRAERIVRLIHEQDILQEWNVLIGQDSLQVEEGAIIIARAEYPSLKPEKIFSQLDAYAETLSRRLPLEPDPIQTLEKLNELLFEELGYQGNQSTYYEPANSYLNDVIERRTGIPISLSVLYMSVARRVGLQLHGVGTPMHFMVKFEAENDERFIDVFRQGNLLTREECAEMLRSLGIQYHPSYLQIAPTISIWVRMLRNLIGVYQQAGHWEKTLTNLNQLLKLEPDSEGELFLRATVAAETGDTDMAFSDIEKIRSLPDSIVPEDKIQALYSRLIASSN